MTILIVVHFRYFYIVFLNYYTQYILNVLREMLKQFQHVFFKVLEEITTKILLILCKLSTYDNLFHQLFARYIFYL